ncbi:MAG: Uma2 family endonuclease [Bryobacteraceae bacterium]
MSAVASPAEQRMILRDISWETYIRLCDENQSPATRMFYDEGILEIVTVSSEHERFKWALEHVFEALAEGFDIDFENLGHTTFRRRDLQKAFEPDTCFYVKRISAVRGKSEIVLPSDPAPELVVEVDISRSSLQKLPLFAAMGVGEVWRYEGSQIMIFRLSSGEYAEVEESTMLPGVTSAVLTRLIDESLTMTRTGWLRHVRQWAQDYRPR